MKQFEPVAVFNVLTILLSLFIFVFVWFELHPIAALVYAVFLWTFVRKGVTHK